MTALLETRSLRLDLPGAGFWGASSGRINLLDEIDLSIEPGETLAVVGESGSGKTSLAHAILGLRAISTGEIRFEGAPLTRTADFRALRRRSAIMFQDAQGSLSPRMTVGAAVLEPFRIHGIRLADPRAKAAELLARVGLPEDTARRYPHELSGGQARRAGVARALALEPQLVIADEPTAGLDVSVQAEILNLMADLRDSLGLSYLIITHNLALVRHVADRIAVMYLGRVVETGPTEAVFASPLHPYTASLVDAEPKPDPRLRRDDLAIRGEVPGLVNRPSGCPFHTRCPRVADRCRTDMPEIRRHEPDRMARCHFA